MEDVFVQRMGGQLQTPERLASLERWLFALAPLPTLRATDDASVQRGAALFRSPETACLECHSGPGLTDNRSLPVGTDAELALQVPSLIGVGHRAPFMHTGCAKSLVQRFDPGCGGGELHGKTAHLSPEQIADLVAYLESL